MSEHNKIKNRKCNQCGEHVLGKAHKLKVHARETCPLRKSVQEAAAQQAIMQKLQESWDIPAPVEVPLTVEEVTAVVDPKLFRMADEEVLNAEGD
jgi:hypothetical protein